MPICSREGLLLSAVKQSRTYKKTIEGGRSRVSASDVDLARKRRMTGQARIYVHT